MVHAAIDLACAQADLGHAVAFCSGPGNFETLLSRHGVEVFTLRDEISTRAALPAFGAVGRALRRHRADVVHAHMVAAALVAAPRAWMGRVPLVTCVQNSFSRSAVLMRVGARVITGCDAVARDMQGRGIPSGKLRPILNGVIGTARSEDVGETSEGLATPITIRRPAVVSACGLHWRKGVPDLIAGFKAAAAKRPDLSLHIFGDGPNADEFKAMAAAEPIANIVFHGQTPVLKPYLEAADVFVLASIADPAPLSICEAREAGLAVIGTRVDGIPELLEDGKAGLLVSPHAPGEIAAALLELFDDPNRMAEQRQRSQFRIERLSVRRVAEQTVDVYREVLGDHASPWASLRSSQPVVPSA